MPWLIIGCPLICFGICLPFHLYYEPRKPFLSRCFKVLATVCTLLPAVTAAAKLDPVFCGDVLALLLHSLAIFILEYWFLAGMGLFVLGHICFIIVFLQLFPFSLNHIILLVLFSACIGYFIWKHHLLLKKNITPLLVYGFFLAAMSSFGIAGGSSAYSIQGILLALGAFSVSLYNILFFPSIIHPQAVKKNHLALFVYYAAQLLLSLSCLF